MKINRILCTIVYTIGQVIVGKKMKGGIVTAVSLALFAFGPAALAQKLIQSSGDKMRFGKMPSTDLREHRLTNGIMVIASDAEAGDGLVTASAKDLFWVGNGKLVLLMDLEGNATVDYGNFKLVGERARYSAAEKAWRWDGPVTLTKGDLKQLFDVGCSAGVLWVNGQEIGSHGRYNPYMYENSIMMWCDGDQWQYHTLEDPPL